jgi:hypothetical protein
VGLEKGKKWLQHLTMLGKGPDVVKRVGYLPVKKFMVGAILVGKAAIKQ